MSGRPPLRERLDAALEKWADEQIQSSRQRQVSYAAWKRRRRRRKRRRQMARESRRRNR